MKKGNVLYVFEEDANTHLPLLQVLLIKVIEG
jgi:hypothetical protein